LIFSASSGRNSLLYDLNVFFNTSISVAQTSRTIPVIDCFDILKRYCKLVYESPVARKLLVTTNLALMIGMNG
jgi:hypothetical protein